MFLRFRVQCKGQAETQIKQQSAACSSTLPPHEGTHKSIHLLAGCSSPDSTSHLPAGCSSPLSPHEGAGGQLCPWDAGSLVLREPGRGQTH